MKAVETLPIAKRARGGRPRVSEPRSTVCTWLPASQHDRLIRLAKQREISVSELLRSIVVFALR